MSTIVWILTRKLDGGLTVKSLRDQGQIFVLGSEPAWNHLEPTVRAEMDLNIDPISIVTHKLEGMTRVAMHVVIPIWGTPITEENQNLMDTLRVLRKIILNKNRISTR